MVAAQGEWGGEGLPDWRTRQDDVRMNRVRRVPTIASTAPTAATPAPPSRKQVTQAPMTKADLIHKLSAEVARLLTR